MGDGGAATAAGGLLNGLVRVLLVALVVAVAAATGATADTELRRLTESASKALRTGDASAVRLAEAALATARRVAGPDPELLAVALDLAATAAARSGGDPARVRALWSEALDGLEAAGLARGGTWFDISFDLATLDAAQERTKAAAERVDRLVDVARPTQYHGPVVLSAAGFFFAAEDFPRAARLLDEGLDVTPELLSGAYGDLYVAWAEAQDRAETAGDSTGAAALIHGRIAVLSTFLPDDSDAVQNLLFQKFFLLHQDEDWGAAANALRAWAAAGPVSPDERSFIEEMASLQLEATQLSGYVERRDVQLSYAELGVAFAELLADPSDPRLGLALRERAAAETGLRFLAEAAGTLRRAAEVLEQTEAGRQALHLVYADLAANAWRRSEYLLATELYDRADEHYRAAVAAGAPPLDPMDRAIDKTNRAQLAVDVGQPQRALDLAEAAMEHFEASAEKRAHKWNERAQVARIHAAASRALLELGRGEEASAAARSSATAARATMPNDHPDLALELGNAADTLFVLGQTGEARALLHDAVAINRAALPATLPQAVEMERKLALVHLHDGQIEAAAEVLRRVAEARKSPAYREALPEAAADFELLAWTSIAGGSLDEAIEALQWTHMTRSAEALAMMEARLALDDPGHAALIRRRQDLLEEHRRASSALLAAYAGEAVTGQRRAAIGTRIDELEAELSKLDRSLQAAGLEIASLSGVTPLSVTEIQALLGEDEMLVTFLLPGLQADSLDWLDGSSNRVVAITRDDIATAPVAEPSRGRLRTRIAEFRCEMAPSDPGCRQLSGLTTRGAMLALDEPDAGLPFDVAGAHRLWRYLFGGIEDFIGEKAHLILVPPADLLNLPFAALVTSDREPARFTEVDWMIRRHAISILPSVTSLRALRQRQPVSGLTPFLGVGDPVIGEPAQIDCAEVDVALRRSAPATSGVLRPDLAGLGLADVDALAALPRLPDAACEIEAIAETLGASNLLLGPAASETAIKRLDAAGRLSKYRTLVFATHGLIAGEAGAAAPGLVLTPPRTARLEDDGLLTAAEIATLHLDAQLVILSACNTAAGAHGGADGLSGIARAFFHAGARSLLVTHWAVYSQAAVAVSTSLLAEMQTNPSLHHAEAHRRAVLRILDAPGQSDFQLHPSYWAAFSIVGVN